MAWNRGNEYFKEVLPFTSSGDAVVKSAAYKALSSLAGPADQPDLIKLLSSAEDRNYITDIQTALASAAGKIS